VIDALYAASAAGVRIDLSCAGSAAMRAGVPGLSENIRVRSVLGRYLEHSRIYRFEHGDDGDDGPMYLIGSADLMPRNLDRRVEVLVPIEHPKHREWLDQVLEFDLSDDDRAVGAPARRQLGADRPARRVRAGRAGADVPLDGRAPAAGAAPLSVSVDPDRSPDRDCVTITWTALNRGERS
jgi:polyphosphate kinase